MRITTHQTYQGHPVPKHVYYPDDETPFDYDVTAESEINYDYASESPDDGSNFAEGATAQNDFKPERLFRCKKCLIKLVESEIKLHICGD